MPQFKVFISSVQKEFSDAREALYQHFKTDPLLSAFFIPILFEKLPAATPAPDKVYINEVGQSQIYVGLLGIDYGFEDVNGVSPTELEYDHATAVQLERWIFIKGGSELKRHAKEEAFVRKVGAQVARKRFMDTAELKQEVSKASLLFLQQKDLVKHTSFDASLHTTATLSDIDEEKIKDFVRTARSKRNFPLREDSPADKVLAHLNMLQRTQLTNSALLLFNKKPQQYFTAAIVKCAHFHGLIVEKPIPDHKVFSGDVFEQVDQAVDFVLSKIHVSVGTRDKSVQAPITYEIPRAAVTEAIVNAVVHRDYNSSGSVQVMLFADRLEITNPGRLPPELSLDKLRVKHGSYPANPKLAECMYLAGYIERYGTGTLDIIRLSEEAHLHEPDFNIDEGFKVVLWRPSASTDQVTDQVPGKYRGSTGEVERVVWVLEGEMKRTEIQAALELRHEDHFRDNYLIPSIQVGVIEMTLPDKPNSSKQRYRLTGKGLALKKSLENK